MLPRAATLKSPRLTKAVFQTCGAEHTFAAAAAVPGCGGLPSVLPVLLSRMSVEQEGSQPSWDGTRRCQREDWDVLGRERPRRAVCREWAVLAQEPE